MTPSRLICRILGHKKGSLPCSRCGFDPFEGVSDTLLAKAEALQRVVAKAGRKLRPPPQHSRLESALENLDAAERLRYERSSTEKEIE